VEELCIVSRARPSMIEPLLCGIVLGLIPITIVGLFVAAWNQYRRGSALGG
jgi:cytochrome b6-f complex subunit 5